jgi:hypothetical protein
MNMLGRSAVAARALVALIVGSGLLAAPPTVAADQSSDIPGIPLPSPVVSGQLGGPVFDVVYRLDVPAGYVIVAGLGGTTGTDFDLFLFDSSATSVASNIGCWRPPPARELRAAVMADSTWRHLLSRPVQRLRRPGHLHAVGPDRARSDAPTARLIVANGISLVNSCRSRSSSSRSTTCLA